MIPAATSLPSFVGVMIIGGVPAVYGFGQVYRMRIKASIPSRAFSDKNSPYEQH
jgi:hypothetical protein